MKQLRYVVIIPGAALCSVSGASINRRLREATDKLKLHASCAVLRVIIDQFASLSEITDKYLRHSCRNDGRITQRD